MSAVHDLVEGAWSNGYRYATTKDTPSRRKEYVEKARQLDRDLRETNDHDEHLQIKVARLEKELDEALQAYWDCLG